MPLLIGGGDRIRTCKAFTPYGFQDRCHTILDNSSLAEGLRFELKKVLPRKISNLVHYHYAILPKMVGSDGIEPLGTLQDYFTPTVLQTATWNTSLKMAGKEGLEPSTLRF
jgi:hypothetical protein